MELYMPSKVVCARCGKPIDEVMTDSTSGAAAAICRPCADWQKLRGLDQEDRWEVTLVGEMRLMPGQRNKLR
jgi:recombinational DNA repair protein (RecF pathway)